MGAVLWSSGSIQHNRPTRSRLRQLLDFAIQTNTSAMTLICITDPDGSKKKSKRKSQLDRLQEHREKELRKYHDKTRSNEQTDNED